MNNTQKILSELDSHLTSNVELTLYGRAALQLGFANPPREYALTRDVDAVLWLGQAEEMNETTDFWQAVDATNHALADQELYISHFFTEEQVVLRPSWKECRMALHGPWTHLSLYRLANMDLLLSKLMRDDPIDHRDALFIVRESHLTTVSIEDAIRTARVPANEEIQQQFERASKRLLARL